MRCLAAMRSRPVLASLGEASVASVTSAQKGSRRRFFCFAATVVVRNASLNDLCAHLFPRGRQGFNRNLSDTPRALQGLYSRCQILDTQMFSTPTRISTWREHQPTHEFAKGSSVTATHCCMALHCCTVLYQEGAVLGPRTASGSARTLGSLARCTRPTKSAGERGTSPRRCPWDPQMTRPFRIKHSTVQSYNRAHTRVFQVDKTKQSIEGSRVGMRRLLGAHHQQLASEKVPSLKIQAHESAPQRKT